MTLLKDGLAELVNECDRLTAYLDESSWCWRHAEKGIENLRNPVKDVSSLLVKDGLPGKAEDFQDLWRRLESWTTLSARLALGGKNTEKPSLSRFHMDLMKLGRLAKSLLRDIEDQEEKSSFVPTTLQKAILKALEGRALKKIALAQEITGGDWSRFYKPGGLSELTEIGLVENKRGLGYFRPDAPPT